MPISVLTTHLAAGADWEVKMALEQAPCGPYGPSKPLLQGCSAVPTTDTSTPTAAVQGQLMPATIADERSVESGRPEGLAEVLALGSICSWPPGTPRRAEAHWELSL